MAVVRLRLAPRKQSSSHFHNKVSHFSLSYWWKWVVRANPKQMGRSHSTFCKWGTAEQWQHQIPAQSLLQWIFVCSFGLWGRTILPVALRKVILHELVRKLTFTKMHRLAAPLKTRNRYNTNRAALWPSSIMHLKALFPDCTTEIRYTGVFWKTS